MEALLSQGFSVQLEHDETETSWEKHGFVAVRDEEGNELARSEDVQHNRNYSKRLEILAHLAQTVGSGMSAAA